MRNKLLQSDVKAKEELVFTVPSGSAQVFLVELARARGFEAEPVGRRRLGVFLRATRLEAAAITGEAARLTLAYEVKRLRLFEQTLREHSLNVPQGLATRTLLALRSLLAMGDVRRH